jgi:putative hydroxymethylpyrimidine transport system substrate-binding protein
MKKRWVKVFLILALIFSVVGCSSVEDQKDLKEVTLMLDWYPNAVHSFIYAAIEKGYFEEEGISLKVLMPAETSDPLKLAASGQTDFALSYQPQLVMARAQSIPVVSISSIVGHPLNILMAKAEEQIETPKDFEGKTVGYSLPVYEAIVKSAVNNVGGDVNKVNFIDVGFDLIPALITKKVDIISGGFINHEKILMEKEGYEIRAIDAVQYGVPDYYELILITGEKMVEDNRDLIDKMRRALKKGQSFVEASPEEALQILLDNQNDQFPLDAEVEKASLEILLILMEDFGKQDLESWQEVIDWMYEMQLITIKPEAEDAFVK